MNNLILSQCPLCLEIVDFYSMMIIEHFGNGCNVCHDFHKKNKTPSWELREISKLAMLIHDE